MPATLANQSHPTESTRVDWWSGTFRLHTPEHLYDLENYLKDLADHVLPGSEWSEPARGRFYETRTRHGAGLQLQFTAPLEIPTLRRPVENQPRINADLASVEITGSVWGFLSVEERSELISDLSNWPGLVRTTRLDLQTTLLQPEQDASWIVQEVAAGRLWPKGFGVGMAYANRNLHGDLHGACTQYFGGKESDIRSRHYDKAAEAGWDIPAVRHEVMLRNEAADQHFRRLADRLQTEEPRGPLFMAAEATTVRDALGSLVDFRDTSRWEGRRKPKKWAQTAPVPAWWQEITSPAPVPLAVEYRPRGDLEASVAACADQYGRKLSLQTLLTVMGGSQDLQGAWMALLPRFMAQLDEGDWKLLDQLRPGCDQAVLREWFARHKAWGLAHLPEGDGSGHHTPPS